MARREGEEDVGRRSLMCEHCGERPAACLGRYEDMEEDAYACNVCCAHGCEDGYCEPIEEQDGDEKVDSGGG